MKLEDLNKKNIHKVPDDYFDELPGRIRKRIEKKPAHESSLNRAFALKFAIPALAAMVILLVWFNVERPSDSPQELSYEELLDQVDTEHMVSYLELQGITTDEILINVDSENLQESLEGYDDGLILEEELNDELIDAIIDQYDLGV